MNLALQTGHVRTPRDSKWDTIRSWMGHQSAKMGHEGTPTDTKMMSVGVMVKQGPVEGSLDGY